MSQGSGNGDGTRTITIQSGDLTIIVTGPSTNFFARDLHTRATVELVEGADITGWEKQQIRQSGEMASISPGDQFRAAVLGALARLYATEGELPDAMSVGELLRDMISDLEAKGRLTNLIGGEEGSERDPA